MLKAIYSLFIAVLLVYGSLAQEKHSSGKGIVVYKVEMDADEAIQLLKANLEAQQIVIINVTNPAAPLSNNSKIFKDFDKLHVDFIQNFLVTSMTTLYKLFTTDPNTMVLSPWVISVYQYEDDDYTYIVRTKSHILLEDNKNKEVIEAVKELESRIDQAIKDMI